MTQPGEDGLRISPLLFELIRNGALKTLMLKPEEACVQLRIGRTRVYELMRTGALVSVKIGGTRLIRATDLAAYAASLPAEPPGDPT